MRHFFLCRAALRLTRTPLLLAGRVSARSPGAALVTSAGGPHAEAALLLRARSVAVNMPGIALAADLHRDPAAPAVVSPERPLAHRNAILFQDWTMPCGACITEPWSCSRTHRTEGPGSTAKSDPRAFAYSASGSKNNEDERHREHRHAGYQ